MTRAGSHRRRRSCATRSRTTKDFPGVTGQITHQRRSATPSSRPWSLKVENGKYLLTATIKPESVR